MNDREVMRAQRCFIWTKDPELHVMIAQRCVNDHEMVKAPVTHSQWVLALGAFKTTTTVYVITSRKFLSVSGQ